VQRPDQDGLHDTWHANTYTCVCVRVSVRACESVHVPPQTALRIHRPVCLLWVLTYLPVRGMHPRMPICVIYVCTSPIRYNRPQGGFIVMPDICTQAHTGMRASNWTPLAFDACQQNDHMTPMTVAGPQCRNKKLSCLVCACTRTRECVRVCVCVCK